MTSPVIDTHSHIVPPDMWKAMRTAGKSYGVDLTGDDKRWIVRLEGSTHTRPMYMPLTNTTERLAAMDRQGVDMQVLAGYVDFSGYTMPLDLGIKFSELQNDTIAGVVAANPDRYLGAANLPLQELQGCHRADGAGDEPIRLQGGADRDLSRPVALPRRSRA